MVGDSGEVQHARDDICNSSQIVLVSEVLPDLVQRRLEVARYVPALKEQDDFPGRLFAKKVI